MDIQEALKVVYSCPPFWGDFIDGCTGADTDVFPQWASMYQKPMQEAIRCLADTRGSMSRHDAIRILGSINEWFDTEVAHAIADIILLNIINDTDVDDAFQSVDKWYA